MKHCVYESQTLYAADEKVKNGISSCYAYASAIRRLSDVDSYNSFIRFS